MNCLRTLLRVFEAAWAISAKLSPSVFPEKIDEIVSLMGRGVDVYFVTFMSCDGSKEYGKKAVIAGDDCDNPIEKGLFSTPTKESDEQCKYSFGGWATTPGGEADSNALKKVTEDRILYANFISIPWYCTVTFCSYSSSSKQYGKVSVLRGEDCPDPIESGLFDTPTRSSTSQYHYTFSGWATAPNGLANADALKGITEDTILYASFTAVRYYTITFKSYDGATTYGKLTAYRGETCPDPITSGLFDTPTKASTAQYDYSFYGWSEEANGAADESILTNISKDLTLYANFASILRYYTITYYDSDGSTVLNTESLAYGSIPSYIPENTDEYVFNCWTPSVAEVTGDASYTAGWLKALSFANSPWAEIAEASEAGYAAKQFAVGDTREIEYTAPDGTVYKATLAIAGFDHDPLAEDASVMAGMSIDCMNVPPETTAWAKQSDYYVYPNTDNWAVDDFLATVKAGLPADLQAVIKTVRKPVRVGTESFESIPMELFPYSDIELGVSIYSTGDEGTRYSLFRSGGLIKNATVMGDDKNVEFFLRSVKYDSTGYVQPLLLTSASENSYAMGYVSAYDVARPSGHNYVRFGFCI